MEDHSSFRQEVIERLVRIEERHIADETYANEIRVAILAEGKKTNGRITKLEDVAHNHILKFAVIENNTTRTNWWKDKTGTALIGIIFTALGAGLLLVLQKTDIVDVSTVTASDYQTIDSITRSYESNP